MAALSNRDELEQQFAGRLGKLGARHRRELTALLGNPPNPDNVPESFWDRVQQETEEEAAAMLMLIFLAAADEHGFEGEQAGLAAMGFASSRAAEVAAGYVSTSRDMLATAGQRWQQRIDDAGTDGASADGLPLVTAAEIAEDTESIFGPNRAAAVATTETTSAEFAGGDAGVEASGLVAVRVWKHGGSRPSGHSRAAKNPCPICSEIEGMTEAEWQRIHPELFGPPAHPHCLLPGTIVSARGCVGTYAASYRGPCIRIETGSGRVLNVTPGHPIVTPAGFVIAGEIKAGDAVVIRCQALAQRNDDIQVFIDNFARRHEVAMSVASVAPGSFHGDSEKFTTRCMMHRDETAFGNFRPLPAPSPNLRGSRLPLCSLEEYGEPMPRYSVDSMLVGLSLACHGFAMPLAGTDRTEAIVAAVVDRHRQFVMTDIVASVSRGEHDGPVYDLMTTSGIYSAGGIMVSNCDCFIEWVDPSTLTPLELGTVRIGGSQAGTGPVDLGNFGWGPPNPA